MLKPNARITANQFRRRLPNPARLRVSPAFCERAIIQGRKKVTNEFVLSFETTTFVTVARLTYGSIAP